MCCKMKNVKWHVLMKQPNQVMFGIRNPSLSRKTTRDTRCDGEKQKGGRYIKIIGGKKYCQHPSKYSVLSTLLKILSYSLKSEKCCKHSWKYWVTPWEIFSISIKIIGCKKYCQRSWKYWVAGWAKTDAGQRWDLGEGEVGDCVSSKKLKLNLNLTK